MRLVDFVVSFGSKTRILRSHSGEAVNKSETFHGNVLTTKTKLTVELKASRCFSTLARRNPTLASFQTHRGPKSPEKSHRRCSDSRDSSPAGHHPNRTNPCLYHNSRLRLLAGASVSKTAEVSAIVSAFLSFHYMSRLTFKHGVFIKA